MGSTPISSDPGEISDPTPPPPLSFDEFQRQTSLMTSCTLLWKELSDHFTALEQNLQQKSQSIKHKLHSLDHHTQHSLESLSKRESTISKSLKVALEKLDNNKITALKALEDEADAGEVDDESGVLVKLRSFCLVMDSVSFWGFVVGRKKEIEVLRKQVPMALAECVDPASFVLEVISEVFPVNKREEKEKEKEKGSDLGWACVLVLESLIPVMIDPVIGKERVLVTPSVRERANEIAETWKRCLDERGGIENVKTTPDVHTFLQHLVTFGIVKKEDVGLYRRLVIGSAWRKQMPKLAVSLGLGDKMPELIEELISRHQQLDAVHFTFEVGLVDKFPPVPLLKAYLKDAKKAAASILEEPDNSGRAAQLAVRKEQSALRAVIKCIEEYRLEAEFPPENLKKRLEQLEKAKTEKKKKATAAAAPAGKRTRVSNGGPMPPAKAGRSTNAYVSSFPAPPTFVRSPSHTHYPPTFPAYPSPPHTYSSGSPQTNPYAYSPEAAPPPLPGSYPGVPMNYPVYGGYGNGMAPAYQQAYY